MIECHLSVNRRRMPILERNRICYLLYLPSLTSTCEVVDENAGKEEEEGTSARLASAKTTAHFDRPFKQMESLFACHLFNLANVVLRLMERLRQTNESIIHYLPPCRGCICLRNCRFSCRWAIWGNAECAHQFLGKL